MSATVLDRMRDHDANEERRYLYEGRRVYLTWSWVWFCWTFGIGVCGPDGGELGAVWLSLGPLAVEVYADKAAA